MMFAAYNRWANGRVYDAAALLDHADFTRDTGAYFHSLSGTLNHILVGDRVWMKRFTGEGEAPTALNVTLHTELSKLRAARDAEDLRIIHWVSSLDDKDLAGRFTYMTITDMRVNMGDGANSLFANGGTSLVIHEKADDMKTDPSGNSGARIACGTIIK